MSKTAISIKGVRACACDVWVEARPSKLSERERIAYSMSPLLDETAVRVRRLQPFYKL